ncbi:MAG: hypothetical protein Rubg2KO_00090 [Rubricoccaceae bacterium]
MKPTLLLLAIAIGLASFAGCAAPPRPLTTGAFPDAWEGHWEGELEIWAADSVRQRVGMGLTIGVPDASERRAWTMAYEGQPDRKYALVPVDAATGHWVIDEGEGLLLRADLTGNVLVSRFSVGSTLLMSVTHFEPEQIVFEILSGPVEADGVVAETSENPVTVYTTPNRQRAVLHRATR